MRVLLNGDEQQVEAANLAEALEALNYRDVIVATALNGEFVPHDRRAETPIQDGDAIEVLAPMQGG
ncbi:MAG: sulfur carrier protein ThiS [Pseudomonadota bacterium]